MSLLGDLDPNPEAVALDGHVWDSGADGLVGSPAEETPGAHPFRLDRQSWILQLTSDPVRFEPVDRADDEHKAELGAALLDACADLRVDFSDWVLPLSGGMDSRALLLAFLAAEQTTGLRHLGPPQLRRGSRQRRGGRQGARRDGRRRASLLLDRPLGRGGPATSSPASSWPGEGRTEDFAGYTDGLATWKRLFESGVAGVIRGDEPGWGYRTYHSESYARRRVHLRILDDYPASHLIHRLGLAATAGPARAAATRIGEPHDLPRPHLRRAFNLPTFFAALNDVKTPYVEIVEPLPQPEGGEVWCAPCRIISASTAARSRPSSARTAPTCPSPARSASGGA